MTSIDTAALERAIDELPRRYPGPGGVTAEVRLQKMKAEGIDCPLATAMVFELARRE